MVAGEGGVQEARDVTNDVIWGENLIFQVNFSIEVENNGLKEGLKKTKKNILRNFEFWNW